MSTSPSVPEEVALLIFSFLSHSKLLQLTTLSKSYSKLLMPVIPSSVVTSLSPLIVSEILACRNKLDKFITSCEPAVTARENNPSLHYEIESEGIVLRSRLADYYWNYMDKNLLTIIGTASGPISDNYNFGKKDLSYTSLYLRRVYHCPYEVTSIGNLSYIHDKIRSIYYFIENTLHKVNITKEYANQNIEQMCGNSKCQPVLIVIDEKK
jgi:hypothetical protein